MDKVKQYRKSLADDGFVQINDFFSEEEISSFEDIVVEFFMLQAEKIGDYRESVLALRESDSSPFEKFCEIHEMLETSDKDALREVHNFFPSSPYVRDIFSKKFRSLCEDLLGSKNNRLLIDGPGLFANRPDTDRLLTKWHSEVHYHPKRRKLLNIWFPIFDAKTKKNGTMSFKVKSHLKDFPFSEHIGYTKESENKKNYLIHYEVPENFLSGMKEHFCVANKGDVVLFDRSLIHRSNRNLTKKYSVAIVARAWDPIDDLTLSGRLAVKPYGAGDLGRANLVVDQY